MVFELKVNKVHVFGNLVAGGKNMIPIMIAAVLLSGFRSATFSLEHLQAGAPPIANTLLIAWLNGSVLGPLLLPWLPGNSLTAKGWMAGLLGLLFFPAFCFFLHLEPLDVLMALLVIPSVSSTIMTKTPNPIHLALMALATGIWITARFI
ncbi:MAG: hypothetical protein WCI03_12240 [bacterium]|jgi:hypothetical protein